MVPSLRNVQQEPAVRAFIKAGGQERQGKGSHRIVRMPNGRTLAIPSGVLKIGLLKHLIKTADINEEKFQSLL